MMARFRRRYGGSPLHLLSLAASMAISAAGVAGWFASFPGPTAVKILEWFGAAVVVHDLVLLPLYSLLDRIVLGASRAPRSAPPTDGVPGPVFVRVPMLLSGLLFLVFFPEILRLGDRTFFEASGLHQRVYVTRYLLVSGVLFALAGLAYATRLARRGRSRREDERVDLLGGGDAEGGVEPPARPGEQEQRSRDRRRP